MVFICLVFREVAQPGTSMLKYYPMGHMLRLLSKLASQKG